jgi:hypothetical protein
LLLASPAVCCGLIPTPSSVMMADVAAGTLNSSAANRKTAVKGASSGTVNLCCVGGRGRGGRRRRASATRARLVFDSRRRLSALSAHSHAVRQLGVGGEGNLELDLGPVCRLVVWTGVDGRGETGRTRSLGRCVDTKFSARALSLARAAQAGPTLRGACARARARAGSARGARARARERERAARAHIWLTRWPLQLCLYDRRGSVAC